MAKKKLHVPHPEEWKFKRERKGDEHAKNCNSGYFEPKGRDPNVLEIHHILCVHACSDKTFPDDLTKDDKIFIHVCLANTEWDINSDKNNIGLPRKWAYVMDSDNLTNWDELPCHQVDHPRYLAAVISWMTENVWRKMTSAEEAQKCEYLEGKNVAELFNKGSKKWKKFLQARGKEKGGTKKCLDYCMSGNDDDSDLNENWHMPFSMEPDEDAIPRRARPSLSNKKLIRTGLLSMIK